MNTFLVCQIPDVSNMIIINALLHIRSYVISGGIEVILLKPEVKGQRLWRWGFTLTVALTNESRTGGVVPLSHDPTHTHTILMTSALLITCCRATDRLRNYIAGAVLYRYDIYELLCWEGSSPRQRSSLINNWFNWASSAELYVLILHVKRVIRTCCEMYWNY